MVLQNTNGIPKRFGCYSVGESRKKKKLGPNCALISIVARVFSCQRPARVKPVTEGYQPAGTQIQTSFSGLHPALGVTHGSSRTEPKQTATAKLPPQRSRSTSNKKLEFSNF